MSNKKTILSLFDYSGNWSNPYRKNGYEVIQVDIKHGRDIFEFLEDIIHDVTDNVANIYGVLAAPPCTDFTVSGNRSFESKKTKPSGYINYNICRSETSLFDSSLEVHIYFVLAVLFIIELLKPKFWALENPVGRINSLIPEMKKYGPWYFQPSDIGDPYTKKTGIWGVFNKPKLSPVLPLFGSEIWAKYGGKSERTKELRSITPAGFAKSFYEANH